MTTEKPSPSRLEAFSDGVIAVIITIMVLEFKVPPGTGLAAFSHILPTLAVYLLSFTFTGIYWINHHAIVHRLERVDSLILWTNLFFLFTLSLLPFFTNYLVDKKLDSFSVAIYAASLVLSALGFLSLKSAIDRHLRLEGRLDEPTAEAHIAAERTKGLISLALYAVAMPLAYWRPWVAMTDIVIVTLLWIVPNLGVRVIERNANHP